MILKNYFKQLTKTKMEQMFNLNLSSMKLNEVAGNYKELTLEFKNLAELEFIWISDGKGWKNARKNLNETFDILNHLYNINDLDNGILEDIII